MERRAGSSDGRGGTKTGTANHIVRLAHLSVMRKHIHAKFVAAPVRCEGAGLSRYAVTLPCFLLWTWHRGEINVVTR